MSVDCTQPKIDVTEVPVDTLRVCARMRPPLSSNEDDGIAWTINENQVIDNESKNSFKFNATFGPTDSNMAVYNTAIAPIVR